MHLAHFDILSAFAVSFCSKRSTSELRFLPRIAFHSKHKHRESVFDFEDVADHNEVDFEEIEEELENAELICER